jgi:hypothetical protein
MYFFCSEGYVLHCPQTTISIILIIQYHQQKDARTLDVVCIYVGTGQGHSSFLTYSIQYMHVDCKLRHGFF